MCSSAAPGGSASPAAAVTSPSASVRLPPHVKAARHHHVMTVLVNAPVPQHHILRRMSPDATMSGAPTWGNLLTYPMQRMRPQQVPLLHISFGLATLAVT